MGTFDTNPGLIQEQIQLMTTKTVTTSLELAEVLRTHKTATATSWCISWCEPLGYDAINLGAPWLCLVRNHKTFAYIQKDSEGCSMLAGIWASHYWLASTPCFNEIRSKLRYKSCFEIMSKCPLMTSLFRNALGFCLGSADCQKYMKG